MWIHFETEKQNYSVKVGNAKMTELILVSFTIVWQKFIRQIGDKSYWVVKVFSLSANNENSRNA